MTACISIERLSKHFGSNPAVVDVSLQVEPGSIYALLGDNGAGKSTTIRTLVGLIKPDGGRASILGHDCWREAPKLRHLVGYMPERPKFYDWMTVEEIGWFTSGFHRDGFLPRYRELIRDFDLNPRARLSQLSKGQYAKTGLSLALAIDPQVLILDEPTSGLDLLVRREFLSSMVDLVAGQRSVLIASHQIAEVERIASHVAFMAHGRVLWKGTLDELRERVIGVRLRFEADAPDPADFGRVLERNGSGRQWYAVLADPNRGALAELRSTGGIHDFEEVSLSLEEIYCALARSSGGQP